MVLSLLFIVLARELKRLVLCRELSPQMKNYILNKKAHHGDRMLLPFRGVLRIRINDPVIDYCSSLISPTSVGCPSTTVMPSLAAFL